MLYYREALNPVCRKHEWGSGPWLTEPDEAAWSDEETGYSCAALRHPRLGHWCGYVGLPAGHPGRDLGIGEGDTGVHGGISYSDPRLVNAAGWVWSDEIWWLGFDCGHSWDYQPGLHATTIGVFGPEDLVRHQYRDLTFVQNECHRFAQELSLRDVREKPKPPRPVLEVYGRRVRRLRK